MYHQFLLKIQFALSALLTSINESEVFQKSTALRLRLASKTPYLAWLLYSVLAPHHEGMTCTWPIKNADLSVNFIGQVHTT